MKKIDCFKMALLGLALCMSGESLVAQSTNATFTYPALDRWMYPNNPFPTNYTKSSTFASFSEDNDTRIAQYMTGFDTTSQIPAHFGAANYLVRHVRLRLTIRLNNAFTYDPTHDAFATYFATNEVGYQPDTDPYDGNGRPVELFGAGFRNGFTADSFVQTSAYGGTMPATRNAFAAGYSTNGTLVDVSNNVGKTNVAFAPFEVYPFAVGQTTNVLPGEPVPADANFTFDLNLDDPLVRQYVQESLDRGRLDLATTSLQRTTQMGSSGLASFWTGFNTFEPLNAVVYGPVLYLEATSVRTDDTDHDGLPDDWEQFYFHSLSQGPTDDPDGDGQNNLAEYEAGTDPAVAADQLKISSLASVTNGVFALRFSPAASRHYVVEYSSNLQNWTSITNPALTYYTTPGAEWRDDGSQTGGPGTNRFYRIRVTP